MFQMISIRQLEGLLNGERRFTLLDVREPEEYAVSHLDGAVNLPLSRLSQAPSILSRPAGDYLLFPWKPQPSGRQGIVPAGIPGL